MSAARIAGRPLTADQYFLVPDGESHFTVTVDAVDGELKLV